MKIKFTKRIFSTKSHEVITPSKPVISNKEMLEKLKNVSVYKRIMAKSAIPFASKKSQELFKESLNEGGCSAFFQLSDQYQTQPDPSFCAPTTMVCVLNALGIDPRKKWKG